MVFFTLFLFCGVKFDGVCVNHGMGIKSLNGDWGLGEG